MRYLLVAVALAAGCSKEKPSAADTKPSRQATQTAATKTAEKKYLTHEELRHLVQGKTQEEVAVLLGKADKTTEEPFDNSMLIVWIYNEIAIDKFAKSPNQKTKIRFSFTSDGKFKVYDIVHD